MKYSLISKIILSIAAIMPMASAALLHNWSFDDPVGTSIEDTINSANPSTLWSEWDGADITGVTTGTGLFHVNTDVAARQSRFFVGDIGGSDELFMSVLIDSWDFADSAEVRFGFMNSDPIFDSNQITVEARLALSGSDVTLRAVALGGGSSSDTEAVFSAQQTDPVLLVLALDLQSRKYSLSYQIGEGELIQYYTDGDLSGSRDPLTARMYYTTGGDGEIDMYVSNFSVAIPEPGVFGLLAGIGVLALVLIHRRRSR